VGAFVCGGRTLKNCLINHARTFIFSTAMPPYFAGQIQAALELAVAADAERAQLRRIAGSIREAVTAAGLDSGSSSTQIVPIYLGSNEAALQMASVLHSAGFAVRAIRPPTVPAGTSRIRISLTARITMDEIDRLARAISVASKALQQVPSTAAVHG
jgi:8-amino-7-oxononanoate synthase